MICSANTASSLTNLPAGAVPPKLTVTSFPPFSGMAVDNVTPLYLSNLVVPSSAACTFSAPLSSVGSSFGVDGGGVGVGSSVSTAVTVTAQVAVLPPSFVVTVMVALPSFIAITVPVEETAAMVSSLEENVTVLSVAFVGVTVAVSTAVSPSFNDNVVWSNETPVTATVVSLSEEPEPELEPFPPLSHTILPVLEVSSVVSAGVVGSVVSLGTSCTPEDFNTLSNVETASALVMPLLPPKLPSG